MNRSKLFLMVGVFLVAAFAAVVVQEDAEENDAANITVTLTSLGNSTVTISSGSYSDTSTNGTASITIPSGSNVTLSTTPSAGYRFTDYVTEQAAVSQNNPYTATNVTVSMNFFAMVEQVTGSYTVTFQAGTGGSVSRSSITGVPYGSSIDVQNNTVTIDGKNVTAISDGGYSFSSWSNTSGTITADRTITANFSPYTYTVSFVASPSSYGSVNATRVYDVPYGSYFSISGNKCTINGTTVTATAKTDTAQYDYSFGSWSVTNSTRVTADKTVYAYFDRTTINYTVTIQAGTGGSVSASSLSVPYGSSISTSSNVLTVGSSSVTATPNSGYAFSSWTNASGTIAGNRTITANFSDATISVGAVSTAHGSVTVSSPGVTSQTASGGATATIRVSPGAEITFTGTVQQYYTFLGWETGMGSMVSTDNPYVTSNITVDTTIYAGEGAPSTVTIQAGNGGSVSPTRITNVPYATPIIVSGNTLSINGTTVTATPDEEHIFGSWTNAADPIVADRTITANFSIPPIDITWWSNDQYNGKVDILFKFGDSDNKVHTLNMDLYSPTVSEGITTWNPSGFSLTVSVSYPSAQITASLTGGTELSKTLNPGKWSTFIVSIDSDNGTVSVTPIKTFESFTNYTVYEKQTKTVLDFSAQIDGAAVYAIGHTESATGENSPRFQVVSTNVFLNTYGVVLYNPTINLFDYWPQYESLRVNFYSFALYGESITINGTTYQVEDGKITIEYVSSGDEHYLPGVMPNATAKVRTFDLDNIYVTYQDNHAYLTFVPERFTLDLGSYTTGSETISMSGLWYFASMVYEPYTVMEKHLSDWKTFPETSSAQMLLIFIAILIVAGAFVALHIRKSGLGWIDLAIIGCAAVVAFIMLG